MTGGKLLTARQLIDLVLDPRSWRSWNTSPVLTGAARSRGRPVAVVLGECGFLAESIGVPAARRVGAAVRRATAEVLPLVAAPVSGGTRMQEGTPAFVEMTTISAAIADHKAAGLPYLVYLRHPTTCGVMASWAPSVR